MTELARFARSLTKNCGHFTFVHTDILAFMIFARKNSTPGMQMSASMLVSIAVRYLKGTVPPFHKQVYTWIWGKYTKWVRALESHQSFRGGVLKKLKKLNKIRKNLKFKLKFKKLINK